MRSNWLDTILDESDRVKRSLGDFLSSDFLIVLLVVLVGFASFGLGRLSALEEQRPAVTVTKAAVNNEQPMRIGGQLVASRKGSKYHFPWCPGARAMNENNKIWFDSIEDAQRAGYTPAGNCKGLR